MLITVKIIVITILTIAITLASTAGFWIFAVFLANIKNLSILISPFYIIRTLEIHKLIHHYSLFAFFTTSLYAVIFI